MEESASSTSKDRFNVGLVTEEPSPLLSVLLSLPLVDLAIPEYPDLFIIFLVAEQGEHYNNNINFSRFFNLTITDS